MHDKTFPDATELPAVGFPVQQTVRPDPERVAFEAWLNPGNHAGNVSPWVEPGRYEQDTHQLAWLAWRAGRKQERERLAEECAKLAAEGLPQWYPPRIAWAIELGYTGPVLDVTVPPSAGEGRLRALIAELLDTELGELACAGSHAPVENILGRMQAALGPN